MNADDAPSETPSGQDEQKTFLLTFVFGAALIPIALALGKAFSVDLAALVAFSVTHVLSGVAATLPLVALLYWFMRTRWAPLVAFRNSQLEFFSRIGFRLTLPRILALSILAGVSEEMLFRGVLQTAAMERLPVSLAIALPSLLFGVLHARTALYAAIATGVGAYLGLLFWLTGGLVAPIIAHALYDFVAFDWTRRIIDRPGASINQGARDQAAPQ
ncbi:MAG: lysostaphin resistance A-like protein [Parvularculaceae bacterium]